MLRFWRLMIEFRKAHAAVRRNDFFNGEANARGLTDVTWHGARLGPPDWGDGQARALGFTLAGFDQDPDIHVMMNMFWETVDMDITAVGGRVWARVVDTSLPSPSDILEPGAETAWPGQTYPVNPRSVVVLANRPA
jgi:glycogen operon protein